jgi:flagellar basal-body rod protein FlgC
MDYHSAFAISASGMAVEKARLDVTALNIANASSTRAGGTLYQPLTVISAPRQAAAFTRAMAAYGRVGLDALPTGVQVVEVRATGAPPRQVYEPAHPDADARGYVAYPGINPVTEMVNIIAATRAYEANLAAMAAARSMAQRALDIGGNQ